MTVFVRGLLFHFHFQAEIAFFFRQLRKLDVVGNVDAFLFNIVGQHRLDVFGWSREIGRKGWLSTERANCVGEQLGVSDFVLHFAGVENANGFPLRPFDRSGLQHVSKKRAHLAIECVVESINQFL